MGQGLEIDGGWLDSHRHLSFSQEITEEKHLPKGDRSSDSKVKWFDQFLICLKCFVNRKKSLSPPSFFLPKTGVNPLRGFIRPAFSANMIKVRKNLEPQFPLETHAAKL